MIKSLSVRGLNHRIDADLEFNQDLNIITGKNGSGKTTLLKLLWYLISGNLDRTIREIPFQSVSIETDSFSLLITHVDSDKAKFECTFPGERNPPVTFEMPIWEYHGELAWLNVQIAIMMESSLFFPTFRRIEGGFDDVTPTPFENFDEYYSERPREAMVDRATDRIQVEMSRLSSGISVYDPDYYDHRFIVSMSTRDIVNLLREKHTDVSDKTNELHVQLSKEITQKISETRGRADANRVLDDIESLVEKVTKERTELLRPLTVLSKRIIEILRYESFNISSEITFGQTEEAFTSDKLSSGEKQMLSFLCYNALNENITIFIDEPELSLHIDWQRRLLPTLLEQGTDNQFFLATHSPFIYAKYPDKEILLGDDNGVC